MNESNVSLEDVIINFLSKNYKRMYAISYAPTKENIVRALNVYRFCIWEGLFRSVDECVARDLEYRRRKGLATYSYRRMENFIKELGLYRIGGYWMVAQYDIKFSLKYKGSKGEVDVDTTITLYAPLLPDLYIPREHEEMIYDDVSFILIHHLQFPYELTANLEVYRLDFELKEMRLGKVNVDYHHFTKVKQYAYFDVFAKVTKPWGKDYPYSEEVEIPEWLYIPFNVVPRTVEEAIYEREREKAG